MFMHRLKRKKRQGFSLLEMMAASVIVTGTLVPTLAVVRDSMALSREMNHRNVLSIHANYFLEFATSLGARNWVLASSFTTAFNMPAPDGYAAIRIEISMSDDPADGGLTGQLSHVEVAAFDDLNLSNSLDANEPAVRFRTKVAKLISYENEEI